MSSTQDHIRKTFLSGIFATVPLVVTLAVILWINDRTKPITHWLFGHDIPFLGMAIALAAIYATGVVVNSLLGRWLLKTVDHWLVRIPILRQLYLSWKHIALTPGGTEGTFSRVVLIPDESGHMKWMGFTSGREILLNEPMYCVFVPSAPNPIVGRLYFVPVGKCTMLDLSPEEGFKVILSTGNYVPVMQGLPGVASDAVLEAVR